MSERPRTIEDDEWPQLIVPNVAGVRLCGRRCLVLATKSRSRVCAIVDIVVDKFDELISVFKICLFNFVVVQLFYFSGVV